MKKKEFLNQLCRFFSDKGFSCKSNHFYIELTDEVMIVFGLQMTAYGGGYCYMECGYCFKSINKYLPHPKFNQLNLNSGRIMTSHGKAIVFEQVDPEWFENIKQVIEVEIDTMTNLIKLGKNTFIQYYLSGRIKRSWYVLGDTTAAYFGLTRNDLAGHFVVDE